jgi:hypothetical protein
MDTTKFMQGPLSDSGFYVNTEDIPVALDRARFFPLGPRLTDLRKVLVLRETFNCPHREVLHLQSCCVQGL